MSVIDDFIARYWPSAQSAGQQTGIDPRVILAQAGVESGWGQHYVGNNLFGIKGPGVMAWTSEVVNGVTQRVQQSFRAFASPEASFQGYASFIDSNPRYSAARNASSPTAQIAALTSSGYASGGYNAGASLRDAFNTVSQRVSSIGSGTGGSTGGSQFGIDIGGFHLGDPTVPPDFYNHPETIVAIDGNLSSLLSTFVSPGTWSRVAVVVIGVMLIGVALVALILSNGNPQQAISLITSKTKEGLNNVQVPA